MDFLIVTIKLDPHTDAVIEELEKKGYSVLRLNTDCHPEEYSLTCVGDDIIISDNFGRQFSTIEGNKIAYYRKPKKRDEHTDNLTNNFISSELNGFFVGLYSHPKIKWINNRHKILNAQSKLGQMNIANKIGFKSADTIITNDIDAAYKFCEKNNWNIAMKSISTPTVSDFKTSSHFYTVKLNKSQIEPKIQRIKHCPVIIQEYIPKAYELRVTIFGEEDYCCKLDSQDVSGAKSDWREIDPINIKHTIIKLDNKIKEKCIEMLKYYDLSFGTFDFIVTPNEEIIFLELNPNGQWYWIELLTNAEMANTMANLLINNLEKI